MSYSGGDSYLYTTRLHVLTEHNREDMVSERTPYEEVMGVTKEQSTKGKVQERRTNEKNKEATVVKQEQVVNQSAPELSKEVIEKVQKHEPAKWNIEGTTVTLPDGEKVEFPSKSRLFKHLYDVHELNVGEIAKLVGVRYQFVYSVLNTHTSGDLRKARSTEITKSELFRRDFLDGMRVGDIAQKHNANYTFVHSTIRKYKKQLESQGMTIEEAKAQRK